MSYIDPNSLSFKLGVKLGRILRTVIIYAGIGALGYLVSKNTNKGKNFNNLTPNKNYGND